MTKALRDVLFFFFIMIRLLRKDTVCKPSANVASTSSREILDTND